MGIIITILVIIVCLLLIGVILIQNSKGGGLASNFSSSNQIMGVKRTADFLEKATWTLAISLLALSLVSSAVNVRETDNTGVESEIKDLVNSKAVAAPPVSPAPAMPEGGTQPE